jgi:hypothetical protein
MRGAIRASLIRERVQRNIVAVFTSARGLQRAFSDQAIIGCADGVRSGSHIEKNTPIWQRIDQRVALQMNRVARPL